MLKLYSSQTASDLAPLFNTTLGKLYGYRQASKISAPAYNQKNTSIIKQKSSKSRAVLEKTFRGRRSGQFKMAASDGVVLVAGGGRRAQRKRPLGGEADEGPQHHVGHVVR